jgi:hypothetical protein
MIYGVFEKVDGEADKRAAMVAFMEKIAPGPQAEGRAGNDKEFDATTILRISLDEAACKVRTGGPRDEPEDLQLTAWAGVLPFVVQKGAPVRDEACVTAEPGYVTAWV